MWKMIETGVAQWHAGDGIWNINASGGDHGVTLHARDRGVALASLVPVGDDRFPAATESFVRDDEWHVDFPQQDGSYSVHLVFRPIEASASDLLLESTISIQTNLLDTHPTLDFTATGDGFQVWTPKSESKFAAAAAKNDSIGAGCLTGVVGDSAAVTVMLDRHDYPWTLDLSDDAAIRLRLFGEFLEKGVIRKARPWICIQRGVTDIDESQMIRHWESLQASPLPLTA